MTLGDQIHAIRTLIVYREVQGARLYIANDMLAALRAVLETLLELNLPAALDRAVLNIKEKTDADK